MCDGVSPPTCSRPTATPLLYWEFGNFVNCFVKILADSAFFVLGPVLGAAGRLLVLVRPKSNRTGPIVAS